MPPPRFRDCRARHCKSPSPLPGPWFSERLERVGRRRRPRADDLGHGWLELRAAPGRGKAQSTGPAQLSFGTWNCSKKSSPRCKRQDSTEASIVALFEASKPCVAVGRLGTKAKSIRKEPGTRCAAVPARGKPCWTGVDVVLSCIRSSRCTGGWCAWRKDLLASGLGRVRDGAFDGPGLDWCPRGVRPRFLRCLTRTSLHL